MSNAPDGHEVITRQVGTKAEPLHVVTDIAGDYRHEIYRQTATIPALVCRADHVLIVGDEVSVVSAHEFARSAKTAQRVVGTVTAYVRAERFEED